MIGWALKKVMLWSGLALFLFALVNHRTAMVAEFAHIAAPAPSQRSASRPSREDESASLVLAADPAGHVVVDAIVNGAAVKMLIDTGATLVALTPRDAEAAGVNLEALEWSAQVATAAGFARAAPLTLREIRLGQLSVYDIPAEVLRRLNISLLGMSFLDRLKSYEMRRGKLILRW